MSDASLIAAHAEHLRLAGRATTTIYARKRAITRLANWLTINCQSAADARYLVQEAGSTAPRQRGAGPVRVRSPQLRLSGDGVTRYGRPHATAGDLLLDATPADLARWRASLTLGDDATVAYVSHVQQFYAWAVADGLLAHSPAEGLPVPRLARRIPRPVSEDDLVAAVQSACPRVRPWLVLAGWAGLRAKEIAYLRRDLILDTATPPVLVVAADATKGHSERTVPLSVFVLAELHACGLPGSGWAFPRHDGQPGPNKPWQVSHLANRALRESGTAATLHQLRHRFLTQCYRATRDLRLVQELAGHSSPVTTAGYAAWDRAQAVVAVESIPAPGRRLRTVSRRVS